MRGCLNWVLKIIWDIVVGNVGCTVVVFSGLSVHQAALAVGICSLN